jgi:hypothetical protein
METLFNLDPGERRREKVKKIILWVILGFIGFAAIAGGIDVLLKLSR